MKASRLQKQQLNQIYNLNYLECKQLEHHLQQLSYVCLDDQCSNKRLICITCEQKTHKSHSIIPFKDFLKLIHQQRKFLNNMDQLKNSSKSKQQYNLIYYVNQIQQLKLNCLKKINQIKNKFLNQIDSIIYTIENNAQKYISRASQFIHALNKNRNIIEQIKKTIKNKNIDKLNQILDTLQRNYSVSSYLSSQQQNKQNEQQVQLMSLKDRILQIQQTFQQNMKIFQIKINQFNISKLKSSVNSLIYKQNFSFDVFQKIFDWDFQLKSPHFAIKKQNNKIIYSNAHVSNLQRFALIKQSFNSQLRRKVKWSIKINCLSGWIGLGICIKQVVSHYQFKFNSGSTGHGSYMISFNGYSWSHSQFSNNAKNQSFAFYTGDIIIMEFDPIENQLHFKKHNKQQHKFTLNIQPLKNNQQFCPCVNLISINDQVQIVKIPKY